MSEQARHPLPGSWHRRPCSCRLQYGLYGNTGAWSLELPCTEHAADEHSARREDEGQQEAENIRADVRALLTQHQPAFSAALETLITEHSPERCTRL
jgi:hypothetical protein